MRGHKGWARATAAAVALVTGWTLSAAPAAAGDAEVARKAAAAGKPTLQASAMKAAANAPRSAVTQSAQATPSSGGEGFLGSTKAKVAAALFLGGLAWTIYSNSDGRDPVKSPIR